MTMIDEARSLLASDPDEMDEEWLAGIIATIRIKAIAAEREACAKRIAVHWEDDKGAVQRFRDGLELSDVQDTIRNNVMGQRRLTLNPSGQQ